MLTHTSCLAVAYPNGTLSLSCVAFGDGVREGFQKAGLAPASCLDTTFETPGESSGTSDPEMMITACPEWTVWMGWSRQVPHILGKMRQELILKTDAALKAFVHIMSSNRL